MKRLNANDRRKHKTESTVWELRTYDVWGNAKEGFEVNDSYRAGTAEIDCRIEVNNAGTPHEFNSAYPSDSQIRSTFGLRRYKLDLQGDDLTIYVNRARDSYPLGEMHCISHDSLSPIRKKLTYRVDASTREAFQFFSKNAGGIVGSNAKTALTLARAEQWAENEGYTFEWSYDDSQPYDDALGDHECWCKDARRWKAGYESDGTEMYRHHGRKKDANPDCNHEILWCAMKDANGNIVQSLSAIIDPDSSYRRVVEAELALEEMPTS